MTSLEVLNYRFSENDIRMLLQPAPKRRSRLGAFLWSLTLMVSMGAIAFAVINLPALIQLQQTPSTTQTSTQIMAKTANISADAVGGDTPSMTPKVQLPSNTLAVSDLNISAPVNWNTPLDDKIDEAKLENGVIHIAGTALPGQHGKTVISGHSSNYVWDPGQYNSVFAALHKAAVGQEIDLNYNGVVYIYQVEKVYQVEPTDLYVLQDDSGPGLRLITCTPIGTSWHRLVVDAKQISPDPSTATPFKATTFTQNLPGSK